MKTDYTSTILYDGTVEVKFYGATPDKPNRHMYYVNGERLSGVTTIIGIKDKSRALLSWQQNTIMDALLTLQEERGSLLLPDMALAVHEPGKVKQRAADVGTEAHDWIEKYIKSKIEDTPEPDMPEDNNVLVAITGFLNWEADHKVRFLSSERLVYSKKYKFVGTLDIEAEVDGKRCLVDIKTSTGLYNDVRLQTAAYLKADEEEGRGMYAGRWAVRLSKETETEANQRHDRKCRIAAILGKTPPKRKEYSAFEAVYLDADKNALRADYEAFKAAQKLHKWNNKTEVYEN